MRAATITWDSHTWLCCWIAGKICIYTEPRHHQARRVVCRKRTLLGSSSHDVNKHIYSELNPGENKDFQLTVNIESYEVIKMQGVCFSLSLETENMESWDPSSQPPLSDSKWSPAFNLVPLQMSGRQRASSVTAIDQALSPPPTFHHHHLPTIPMDGASQGSRAAHQSRTSQLALTGSLQRMPSLSTQPMSFTHILTMSWQTRGERRVVLPWGNPCCKCQSAGAGDAIWWPR